MLVDGTMAAAIPVGLFLFGTAKIISFICDAVLQEKLDRECKLRQQAELRAEEERRRAELEREHREALEQHMLDLGIDPIDPEISHDDIEKARRDIDYDRDPYTVNIAVTGNIHAGKSSLLNAIRNLSDDRPGWAPAGGFNVTLQRHRYP
ncbi:hypothetical protein V8C34DRAFT_177315 [Trichoderma compactum]